MNKCITSLKIIIQFLMYKTVLEPLVGGINI